MLSNMATSLKFGPFNPLSSILTLLSINCSVVVCQQILIQKLYYLTLLPRPSRWLIQNRDKLQSNPINSATNGP